MKKIMLSAIFIPLILTGCGSGDQDQVAREEAALDSIMNANQGIKSEFSEEVISKILESIPSPIEITAIIRGSGAAYDEGLLNDPDNSEKYHSLYSKALNLGVYGADMQYITIYEKTSSAFPCVKVIKGLADELNVGQFIDLNTMKRLTSNTSNTDSLTYIFTSNFESMDKYLRSNKRGNISTLILLGGWIEGLSISSKVVERGGFKNNQELVERIGEQKIILDDIILLLSAYDKDPNTKKVKEKILALKKLYEKVNIVKVYAEPETKEVDGMLVIVDNSTSKVEISEEIFNEISKEVNKIRNEIIQGI